MRLSHLVAAACMAMPLAALAGVFSVSPIRLDLSSTSKTGSVVVGNEGAPLTLKTSLMRWTQDAEGKDIYTPSTDLVYFPRDTEVPQGGSRVVRAALNTVPGEVEQAYRLYIEEVQPPRLEEPEAKSRITVLVRFGLPVYIRPRTPAMSVSLTALPSENGQARAELHNTGNVHLYIKSLAADGVEFSGFKARYLLPGAAVPVLLSAKPCAKAPGVTVDTEEGPLSATLPAGVCGL